MKSLDVDIGLLLSIKSRMENLIVWGDNYNEGRSIEQIVRDGDAPEEYTRLCELIEDSK